MSAQIASRNSSNDHWDAVLPIHNAGHDKGYDRNAVDDEAHDAFQRVHGMNIRHAERYQHGEHHNSHPTTEITSIDGDGQLKESRRGERSVTGLTVENGLPSRGQFFSEGKEQSSAQGEPRKQAHEGMRRSFQQQKRTRQSSYETCSQERNENAPRNIEMPAISASTGCSARP